MLACVLLGAAWITLQLPAAPQDDQPLLLIAAIGAVFAGCVAAITWLRPWWVMVFACAWTPLESTILARLPLPQAVQAAAEGGVETVLYLTLFGLIAQRLVSRQPIPCSGIEKPIIGLLIVGWASTMLADAPLIPSLMNLRSLLRFAAAYFILIMLPINERRARQLMWVLAISVAFQIALSFLQIALGKSFSALLAPEAQDGARRFRMAARGREKGAVFGTLGDTVFLAAFACCGMAVWLHLKTATRRGAALQWACVLGLLIVLAKTYSRAAVITGLATLGVYAAIRIGTRKAVLIGLALVATLFIGSALLDASRQYLKAHDQEMSTVDNLTSVFTIEYLERAKNNRLGSLIGTSPTLIANAPLTGFGFDTDHAVDQLNKAQPNYLTKHQKKKGFEDVYWVAMLCYGGLPGLLVFAWLIASMASIPARLGWHANSNTLQWVARATVTITLQGALLMWFFRAMEFRAFGLYAWVLLGLTVSLHQSIQTDANKHEEPLLAQ